MKPRFRSPLLALPLVVALHGQSSAQAINKDTDGTDLTLTGSWVGDAVPGSGNVATWVTGSLGGALTMGSNLSWQGIDIQGATGAIITSGAGTLTLGSSGINIAAGGVNLSLGNNVTVGANQNWTVGSGRTLTFSNTTAPTLTFNADVTLDGAGSVVLGGGNIALAGAGALIVNSGTLTNNMQTGSSSSRTGTTTLGGGSIIISSDQNIFGTGAINLNGGAIGSGTATGRSYSNSVNIGGNVRIGGTGFGSGTMTFSGPINLGGATRQIDSGITGGQGTILSGAISNGGLTLNSTGGAGILTLGNDSNTYTGATTVTSGYLAISKNAISNSSSISLAANTRLFVGVNGTTNINNLNGVSTAGIRTDFTITGTSSARTLSVNQTVDGAYAGTFTEGGSRPISLIKTGAAKLTLSGTGGYTGGTTISQGTLALGSAGAVGSSGTITMDGGTLQFSSGNTTDYSARLKINDGKTATFDTNGQNVTFATSLQVGAGGTGALSKVGTGTLTLSGANTYTGATTVSAGQLNLTGSLSSNVTVSGANTVISGTGSTSGSWTQSAGTILLDVANPTSALTASGTVDFSGSTAITLNGQQAIGTTTYHVMNYGSLSGNGTAFLTHSPYRSTGFVDDTVNKRITIAIETANRTWSNGASNMTWDSSSSNWAEADNKFFLGDAVTFGDTGAGTVTVSGTVTPSAIAFTNSTGNDYTLQTGVISGAGGISKSGGGRVTLSGLNTYTGGTSITEGTVSFANGGLGTSGSVTMNGGTLQWAGGNTQDISSSSRLVLVNGKTATLDTNGNDVTLGTAFGSSTSAVLEKTGSGTLTLSGANTFSGGLSITAGTVKASAANNLGTGAVTIGTSGTLNTTSGMTISALISGSGTLKASSGVVILTGTNNTFSGLIDVQAGDVVLNDLGSENGTPSVNMSGGRFLLSSPFVGQIATIGNLTGTAGTINPQYNATTGIRTLQVNQTTDGIFAGNIQDGGGSRFVGLIKTGNAALTLSGSSSSYTGGTMLSQGTLIATHANALGTGGTITINDANTGSNNTTLNIDATGGAVTIARAITVANEGTGTVTLGSATTSGSNAAVFSGAITLARDVTLNGGTAGNRFSTTGGISGTGNVTIAGTNRVLFVGAANTYGGTTSINTASTLQLSDGTVTATSFIPDSSAVTVNSGGFLKLAKGGNSETIGALTGPGTVEAISGNDTLIVGSGDASSSFGGALKNNGGTLALTKTGAGTLTLTGSSHDYTGATTVTGGTLVINGNISTSTLTTVESGATIGGKGTVGALTVLGGGTLAPGTSPDTLNTGTLTLADTSISAFELNPSDQTVGGAINDLVNITGSLTLDGILNVVATSGNFLSAVEGDMWRLFNYSGSLTDNTLTLGTMPALGTGLDWSVDTATAGEINLVVVPEPGAALLGGLGLLCLLRRRRC